VKIEGGYKMSVILKLTAIAYLLTGLGMNAALVSYGAPDNKNITSVPEVLEGGSFVSRTIAQDPPPPDDDSGLPNGETGDAGSRV
jgi:hypothetical protein